MTRQSIALFLLALTLGLAGCESAPDEDGKKKPVAVTAAPVAPASNDDKAWKLYLQQVVQQNMAGVTDRVFPYYLPADNATIQADGRSQFDRQAENVTAVVTRTVLPGNMLVFGSPDSKRMADLVTSAFSGAKPDALKGSQVLFIGTAEDSARVKPLIEAAGAKYIFVEAK